MLTITGTGKKIALKSLRNAGNEFIDGFRSVYNLAIPLRSKEPGVCWKAGGQVSFAAISEFSGPNSTEEDAPFLLRLRTNMCPPPAINYHLRSPAVRQKLGLSADPMLAVEPVLEVTTLPEEMGKFGCWLTKWFDSYFYQRPQVPAPPVQLISWGCGSDLEDERDNLIELGRDWRLHQYLWSPGALERFDEWLKK
jgi:hypothetical protein